MATPGVIGVRLSFYNPNDFGQGFRVYRKEEDFDQESLPEPLATIPQAPKGMVSWIDETADPEVEYYYLISAFYHSYESFAHATIKASAYAGPLAIGEFYGGGYYIGNIYVDSTHGIDEGTYAILMGGLDTEPATTLQWKTATSETANTGSTTDGWGNTQAMAVAGIEAHPAGKYCLEFRGGGFDDWYLPSKDELNLAWANRNANGLSSLLEFRGSEYYWSSTQNSANLAWRQRFSTGNQSTSSKTNSYRVRPVRRLKLMI